MEHRIYNEEENEGISAAQLILRLNSFFMQYNHFIFPHPFFFLLDPFMR
jgi:hypothetical protein